MNNPGKKMKYYFTAETQSAQSLLCAISPYSRDDITKQCFSLRLRVSAVKS